MHRIQGWTGLRAAVIALGLVAWTATGATAAPLSYTTSGQVDTTTGVSSSSGGTADNVVSFVPLSSGNSVDLSTGQTNASLGNFVISPLADGVTTTYSNTPIQISFQPASYNGTSISSDAPVVVSGVLNGVVNGPSSSTVIATLNPPPNGMFSLGGSSTAEFSIPTSTLLLAPSTSNSGVTTAQGLVTTESVPEPSTIALFLTTVGGLGLRRYVLSRRRSARV